MHPLLKKAEGDDREMNLKLSATGDESLDCLHHGRVLVELPHVSNLIF